MLRTLFQGATQAAAFPGFYPRRPDRHKEMRLTDGSIARERRVSGAEILRFSMDSQE